jgi:DNA polymerase III subunit delta
VAIIFYWGDDEYAIERAARFLIQAQIDPAWKSFNYEKIGGEGDRVVIQALETAMTPPFGMGDRLVWLVDTNVCQQSSPELIAELERTLPHIPDRSYLLITSKQKPDGRLKSTKLIQKYAQVSEYSTIPPWKTAEIIQKVHQAAAEIQLPLTAAAAELLADSIGNNTRQLYLELEKLQLFIGTDKIEIDRPTVERLIVANTHNSLQLAAAIRQGDMAMTLGLIDELIVRNEPALKITATLVGQFRTWLWVKVLWELAATLPILLDLEFQLKRGSEPKATLQAHAIELCQLFCN